MIIDGKQVRGRKNRWGVINIEDENHCEFVYLRNFLTRFVPPSFPSRQYALLTRFFLSFLGRTCRTSLKRRLRSTTRRSARSSCLRSRRTRRSSSRARRQLLKRMHHHSCACGSLFFPFAVGVLMTDPCCAQGAGTRMMIPLLGATTLV